MSDIAIRVEGLGKEYGIGARHKGYRTVREVVADACVAPFRRAGNLLEGRATGAAELNEAFWALKNISFEITRGEIVGVIGRNGAGKSTLLKILSRITEPTQGYGEVHGRVATLLEVGIGFHPELTGRENIYLNGSILGMTKAEIDRKFDDILAFAEIEKFIETPVKHYSTGMAVRLGFAVAANLDPDILLVDEILAVGDAGFQRKCMGVLNQLREKGRTVLIVSHNMATIENFCSRIICLEGGSVYYDGDPREAIRSYFTLFSSEEKKGRLDLRERSNRLGLGDVRFTHIEFLNQKRQMPISIGSGDSIVIRLHYEAIKQVVNPHFGVDIFSEMGAMVTSLHTWTMGYEIPVLPVGTGYIDLEIDFLNLMPGRYHITLKLEGIGLVHYDILEHCVTLDVETSDYCKTGRGNDRRFGIIFLPGRWNLMHDEKSPHIEQEKIVNFPNQFTLLKSPSHIK